MTELAGMATYCHPALSLILHHLHSGWLQNIQTDSMWYKTEIHLELHIQDMKRRQQFIFHWNTHISVASERMFHERIFRAWSTHVCFTLSFTLVGNFRLHMPQNVSEEKHSLSLHTKGTGLSRTGYGQWLESEWETGYLLKDCALLVKSLNLQV